MRMYSRRREKSGTRVSEKMMLSSGRELNEYQVQERDSLS